MRFLFIVQSEGKGHLTQAIAMYQILTNKGHEVVATMVGEVNERPIPEFYLNVVKVPLVKFDTPSLSYGKGKQPKLINTIWQHCKKAKKYMENGHLVAHTVALYKPDLIINFYEIAGGFYKILYPNNSIPMVCIGHQYLLLHPNFIKFKSQKIAQFLLNLNTKLTAYGASKLLGLSFRPIYNDKTQQRIITVPPLLRNEVKELTPQKRNYFLAYVTHYRLAEEIVKWHKKNKHEVVHCFLEKKNTFLENYQHHNFHYNKIDPYDFLMKMKNCKALITTAGFESVCEAMYYDKPVMMVPIPNHIEQRINAFDGELTGAGIYSKKFKINKFIKYIPNHISIQNDFKKWENMSSEIILKELTSIPILNKNSIIEFDKSTTSLSFIQILKKILKPMALN